MAVLILAVLPAAHASAPKPGDVFKDCAHCPPMAVIPPGSFVMGSTDEERHSLGVPQRFDRMETPRHKVTIAYPFAVGRTSVTFAEWDSCVAGGGCSGYRPDDNGWGRGKRPVINVDWADAQTYVAWLSRASGHKYRLLSEAEWEYAARGGTTSFFYFGKAPDPLKANYGKLRGRTLEVASFPPNAFGLYDMAGNTAQWVEDCYHDSFEGAPTDGSAWLTGACATRNVRGGAWSLDGWCLRAAQRIGDPPDSRNNHLGFRVARNLD